MEATPERVLGPADGIAGLKFPGEPLHLGPAIPPGDGAAV
jgi:hypothetical protein